MLFVNRKLKKTLLQINCTEYRFSCEELENLRDERQWIAIRNQEIVERARVYADAARLLGDSDGISL